jgi:hypothetical protein
MHPPTQKGASLRKKGLKIHFQQLENTPDTPKSPAMLGFVLIND